MSDEARFGARGEEPRPQLVIVAFGREDEGGIRVVELARDGEHLRFGETVCVQYHARRVAGEALAGKCIDLVDLDLPHLVYGLRAGKSWGAILVLSRDGWSPMICNVQYWIVSGSFLVRLTSREAPEGGIYGHRRRN